LTLQHAAKEISKIRTLCVSVEQINPVRLISGGQKKFKLASR